MHGDVFLNFFLNFFQDLLEEEPAHVDSATASFLRSDGSRRIFIGAALTSDGLHLAQLLLDLSTVAKKQMRQFTAMNPSARRTCRSQTEVLGRGSGA